MEFRYEGNSKQSGIYKITNKINKRFYYGSCKSFQQRFGQHKSSLLRNKHQNKFLQADFNKCFMELKNDDFLLFEVVEVVDGDRYLRLKIEEEKYLKPSFDSGDKCYNLINRAVSREGYPDKNPEETSKKMSIAQKNLWQEPEYRQEMISKLKERWQDPEFRKNHKNAMNNEETRKKMSLSKIGTKNALGHKLSKESKEKIIKNLQKSAHLGHKHSNETKIKLKKLADIQWNNEEAKKKQSEILKERWQNPEYREKMKLRKTKSKIVKLD